MQSKASTVAEYIASLPADRRDAVEALRRVVLDNLDRGFEERMQYGMIGYCVPHAIFPAGYHCDPAQPLPFAGIASQKQHMSLYLMGAYGDPSLRAWFQQAWKDSGKRLDMGASCVRFKKIEDVPLGVVGEVFRKMTLKGYVAQYESQLAKIGKAPKPGAAKLAKAAAKKAARKPASRAAKKKAVPKPTRKTARKK